MAQNALLQSILKGVQIVSNGQKENFNKTIQGKVVENLSENQEGELKVRYQNSIIPVFCELDEVENYPKGTDIYINIPNGDMNQTKTVQKKVECVTDFNVGMEEERFLKEDSSSFDILLEDEDFIQDSIKITSSLDTLFLKRNLNRIKELIIRSEKIKISCTFSTFLEDLLRRDGDYGLVIEGLGQYPKVVQNKYCFNIDDFIGNPYNLVETVQNKIIDVSDISSVDELSALNFYYFREGFAAPATSNNKIQITNITFTSLSSLKDEGEQELKMFLIAPSGKGFPQETLNTEVKPDGTKELVAVLKQGALTVDNSNLQCYWFMRNYEIDTQSAQGFDPVAGPGWKRISAKKITGPSFYINKEQHLGILTEQEFLAVGFYKGIELRATITIKDLNKKMQIQLEKNQVVTDSIIKNTYTIIQNGEQRYNLSNVKWYYEDYNYSSFLLGDYNSNKNSLPYGNYVSYMDKNKIILQNIPYDGRIKAVIYAGGKTPIAVLSADIKGAQGSLGLIRNGEQVFLYNSKGNIYELQQSTLEKGVDSVLIDSYRTPRRAISLNVPIEENKNYRWYIPNQNTMLKINTSLIKNCIDTTVQQINGYTCYKDLAYLQIDIDKQYKEDCRHNNILIGKMNLGTGKVAEMYSTRFTFEKEGHNGTNNTGTYLKIVPNSLDESANSITPMMKYKFAFLKGGDNDLGFNFVVNDQNANSKVQVFYPFKIQIWKRNKKMFEGFSSDLATFSDVKWALDTPFQISFNEKTGGFRQKQIGISSPFLNENLKKYAVATTLAVTGFFEGKKIKYILPLITSFSQTEYGFKYGTALFGDDPYESDYQYAYYDEQGKIIKRSKEAIEKKNWQIGSTGEDDAIVQHDDLDNYKYLKRNKTKIYAPDLFPEEGDFAFDCRTISYSKNHGGSANRTYFNIPFILTRNVHEESVGVSWSGYVGDQGQIHTDNIIAGDKNGKNDTLTGVVMGNNSDSTSTDKGVFVYDKGKNNFTVKSTGETYFGNGDTRLKINPANYEITPEKSDSFSIQYDAGEILAKALMCKIPNPALKEKLTLLNKEISILKKQIDETGIELPKEELDNLKNLLKDRQLAKKDVEDEIKEQVIWTINEENILSSGIQIQPIGNINAKGNTESNTYSSRGYPGLDVVITMTYDKIIAISTDFDYYVEEEVENTRSLSFNNTRDSNTNYQPSVSPRGITVRRETTVLKFISGLLVEYDQRYADKFFPFYTSTYIPSIPGEYLEAH